MKKNRKTKTNFASARMIGRPTIDGKIDVGKFAPAKPHFTNYIVIENLELFQ
jgi:hypothetical protein